MYCDQKIKTPVGWYRCSRCHTEWHPDIERPFCFPRVADGHEAKKEEVEQKVHEAQKIEREWTDQQIKDSKLDKTLII